MNDSLQPHRPLIAITSDLMIRNERPTAFLTMTYADAVVRAGGVPVVLPPAQYQTSDLISRFDAFIFSGGDDPRTESFGQPSHPAITPVLPDRQSFEYQLLTQLADHPDIPVLGICLGMQMLALCHHGMLNQHLPDTHTAHADHWEHNHEIHTSHPSVVAAGQVYSKHRQAVSDPGDLRVVASSSDGVIEAIDCPDRRFTLGVQWHPERTKDHALGQSIFDQLITAASKSG